jgi:hypothetical protein
LNVAITTERVGIYGAQGSISNLMKPNIQSKAQAYQFKALGNAWDDNNSYYGDSLLAALWQAYDKNKAILVSIDPTYNCINLISGRERSFKISVTYKNIWNPPQKECYDDIVF